MEETPAGSPGAPAAAPLAEPALRYGSGEITIHDRHCQGPGSTRLYGGARGFPRCDTLRAAPYAPSDPSEHEQHDEHQDH